MLYYVIYFVHILDVQVYNLFIAVYTFSLHKPTVYLCLNQLKCATVLCSVEQLYGKSSLSCRI
jgi:hypothetical protein